MRTTIILLCCALTFCTAATQEKLPPATPPTSATIITLEDFKLTGQLTGDQAAFILTATAHVSAPKGGSLTLLEGTAALTEVGPHPKWRVRAEPNRFVLEFDRDGKFPIQIKFNSAVREHDGWKSVDFRVAPSVLQQIVLQGLDAETQFEFPGAARPERKGSEFVSFLPSDGIVKLSWKTARPETEGKLFYSAELLSQISISPGLMRQVGLFDFKVMQGEMNKIALVLRGAGEVTRVQGDQVLAWNVEPMTNSTDRRLVVQFNQPQKDHFALQIQVQTPLGAFPQSADAMQLRPENATRFAGYYRIVNEGAVRLEVTQATGLSQISPEQFPESDASRAAFRIAGSQKFAYRFSGADFALRIQADQVLPELSVSQVLAYRLGENEQTIEAEIELEIREAPLRELTLHVPRGYAIARLNASGLSDYFVRDAEGATDSELRLVYGQPVSGRQIVQLRLERNQALGEPTWALPRIEVAKAKSTRGHVGVAADAGFRLTAERTSGLTEIATAFFPQKIAGLQAAFRLSEPAWSASVRVERLPQTVQADVLHLFSIGEGIAYGSSVMNYVISGAPVSEFKIELSDEYFNVEFTGKDIRNRQKIDGGYLVQLHTPVSGPYTLLATYERPFKAQGDTLAFTGARPLDAQSEQGHTLIISANQFQVNPVDVSTGLLPLETGEVPSEYRLFFDAPILKAYRYTTRPFNLKLALSPLAQGDSLSQVVDRATLTTRISKEGQVLTDVRYFLKNRGNTHFRLTLPTGVALWSATVNGASVVPVTDGLANLIPLPQHGDPNAIMTLDLKLASRSTDSARVSVAAPVVAAPVMLAEWKLEPDTKQRLTYSKGSLTPLGGIADVSGFAMLGRLFAGDQAWAASQRVLAVIILLAAALIIWRWAAQPGVERFGHRHLLGALAGITALVIAGAALAQLASMLQDQRMEPPRDLSFLIPVQQAGTPLNVEVLNAPDKLTFLVVLGFIWPVVLALASWAFARTSERTTFKNAAVLVGWLLLAWAALRAPNGAPLFLLVFVSYVLVNTVVPGLRRLWQVPHGTQAAPEAAGGAATAVTGFLLAGLIWLNTGCAGLGGDKGPGASLPPANEPALAETVTQDIRIEDKFAIAKATIRWPAQKGQTLPLLLPNPYQPAVLTRLVFPTNSVQLVETPGGKEKSSRQLLALKSGVFDIELQYEARFIKYDEQSVLNFPVQYGLINRLKLAVINNDVDVLSPQAVTITRELAGSNTVASVVFSPGKDLWVAWRPRTRDVKREKPVFYAEVSQLYAPAAGVIEGAHYIWLRPAQGELSEVILDVPAGATVTDVLDPAKPTAKADGKAAPSLVSLWRFDPDTRKLRVTLSPAQSRPFGLLVRSQTPSGPLPFERSLGLVAVEGAAGQLGLFGVATGNEVQLDSVTAEGFSPINLEDFPGDTTAALQARIPGLTLRRALRYSEPKAIASVKASAVEPDVRVETQDTLSLGEDRTVLAVNANVNITRAGIFRLSFLMPARFDVESVSGSTLSHWTELKTDAGRIITLHLNGKTEGQQQFAISLAGPGLRATNAWPVPQLIVREASKQRGTLLVVPEQGMRLQVANRDGVTQLDPQKAGIRQKGVLAFRILQTPWNMALTVEQVDPWIQVTSLQHATINEALVKVVANLQYQIENTGLKTLRVYVPTNAEGVRFQGEQLADYIAVPGAVTNGLQQWEIKLHRRIIGSYLLQATYQVGIPEMATTAVLRGVEATDVNLQRGFVTVQAAGRLQVSTDTLPEALQPTEWQSIPRVLQQDLPTAVANLAYRLVEPAFNLPVKIERHEAAKLLQARVNGITFNSVISDDGVMLTQARVELQPGDKPLLNLTLPKDAKFWFAFVNQNGVWPWRKQDQILIPLEQQTHSGKPLSVEIFYSCQIGAAKPRELNLQLLAPKFDLPLENIVWRVSLSEKWRVTKWSGSLQLAQDETLPCASAIDLQSYLSTEATFQRERTKEAEDFMAAGNAALQGGEPAQARRAFQAAYGLSGHDAAFNEDARVQLHNIKLQQALIGLNVRQASASGDNTALGGKFRDLRARKEVAYTQQDAKDIIDRNTADDNAAYMRLAERLIQQQDAAVTSPATLRANVPQQGRVLTFKRSVAVDPQADLNINLKVAAARAASSGTRLLILLATLGVLGALGWAGRRMWEPTSSAA